MKYLRKYNENLESEYYQDITNQGFEWTMMPFDDNDKKILFSKGFCFLSGQMNLKQDPLHISISKSNDEWYIVSSYNYFRQSHKLYRCDQLDGLIKLLKLWNI